MKKGLAKKTSATAPVTATTNKWGQVSGGVKGVNQSTIVKGFNTKK